MGIEVGVQRGEGLRGPSSMPGLPEGSALEAGVAVVACPDPERRAALAAWLGEAGWRVAPSATGTEALGRARADGAELLVLAGATDLSEREAVLLLGGASAFRPATVTVGPRLAAPEVVALCHHAAQARRLEREVAASARRFDAVVQASPVPLAIVDGDLRYLSWNPRWAAAVASRAWHPDHVARGLTLADHAAEEHAEPLREAAGAALASGEAVAVARAAREADGSAVPTSMTFLPLAADPPLLLVYTALDGQRGADRPLQAMIAATPVAACVLDGTLCCTAVNGALLHLLDLPEADVLGRSFPDFVDRADRRRFAAAGVFGGPVHLTLALVRRDGSRMGSIVHTTPAGAGHGPDRVLVLVTEAALAAVASTAHLTRSSALTAIVRRLTNRDVEAVLPDVLHVVAGAVRAEAAGLVRDAPGDSGRPLTSQVVGRTGALLPGAAPRHAGAGQGHRVEVPVPWPGEPEAKLVAARSSGAPFAPQEVRFLAEVAGVVAEALARQEGLRAQVRANTHDRLTDLFNRGHLVAELEVLLRRARGRVNPLAVLAADIDDFHFVNDGLSYAVGDGVLRLIGQRLRLNFPADDLIARTGGDEFVLVARDPEDLEHTEAMAEELAAVVAQPFEIDGTEVQVSVSVGFVLSGDAMETAEDLVKQAQLAMVRAKHDGGGRCEGFSDVMRSSENTHADLVRDIRRGVEHGEFEPWYQPLVRLDTGEVVGVEALARWRHPTRGILLPAEFIEAAEETRLITQIGQRVLERACLQAAMWRGSLAGGGWLRCAVNVSGRQLTRADFAETVASAVTAAKVDSRSLTIEITESVLMEDPAAAVRTLQRLKDLGTSVAVDDFGTGYSSLAYLRQFPVDELKVDRRFVSGLGAGGAPEIATAIVRLAQSLRLGVVAEGVETPDQARALRALGVAVGQGFIWSGPMPAHEFAAWFQQARGGGLFHIEEAPAASPTPPAEPQRPEVDRVVLEAVRAILRVEDPWEATAVLSRMVRQLGGYTVPARLAHGRGLPFDLALGEGEPVVAVAEEGSVSAMLLAEILPEIVDDATLAIANAHQAARLASDASLDPLTGLLNRRGLSRAYSRLRDGDAVGLIDLDHFKEINDSFGHPAGDEVLRSFGRMLRDEARVADYIGRIGGDEFVVVLLRSDAERVRSMLERMRDLWLEHQPLPVTFSAGVAEVGPGESVEDALHRADLALYQVKERGRDGVAAHRPAGTGGGG